MRLTAASGIGMMMIMSLLCFVAVVLTTLPTSTNTFVLEFQVATNNGRTRLLKFVAPPKIRGSTRPRSTKQLSATPPEQLVLPFGTAATVVDMVTSPDVITVGGRLVSSSASSPSGAIPESILWVIRVTSALLSYIGLIAYVDRPQGGALRVNPETEIDIQSSSVPGAGLGLFAKTKLRKGTILGTYPGVLLPITQRNLIKVQRYPQCEAYIWRFSDNAFILDPTNTVGELESTCRGGSLSWPGSSWLFTTPLFQSILFRGGVPTTLCRINEPPIGKDVNVITEEDVKTRTVTFLLERDVQEGEEFFIDYGTYFALFMSSIQKKSVFC